MSCALSSIIWQRHVRAHTTHIKCTIQNASSNKGQFPRPEPCGIRTNPSIQHLTPAHTLQNLSSTTNSVLSCFTTIFCPHAFTRTDVSLQPIKWCHKFWHQLQHRNSLGTDLKFTSKMNLALLASQLFQRLLFPRAFKRKHYEPGDVFN